MEQRLLSSGLTTWRTFGSGPRQVIALHAFGRSGDAFARLDLSPQAAIRAPDLPFHGQTRWEGRPLRPDTLAEWLREIAASAPFYLLGNSYSARLALAAVPHLKGAVLGLMLVAPDGLHTPGLRFVPAVPCTGVERWLYLSKRRARIAALLQKTGFLGRVEQRFVRQFILPQEQWHRTTWPSWQAYSRFRFSPGQAADWLKKAGLPAWIALGDRDPVVQIGRIHQWAEKLERAQLHLYRGGHQPPWPALSAAMKQWLAWHSLSYGEDF
jgi:pimeloyl-ACP methyl ester carboxylesterase